MYKLCYFFSIVETFSYTFIHLLLQTTIALNVFRSKNLLLLLKSTGKHRVDVTTTLNQTATSRNITEHKIQSVGQSSIRKVVERVHACKCKAIIKFQATFFLIATLVEKEIKGSLASELLVLVGMVL